jgi:hypothetical protein
LRVGIDSGVAGIQGPLLKDLRFEYLPIPDRFRQEGIDSRTYGNTTGRLGMKLVNYFPERLRRKYSETPIHYDPEFESFTYGDPTPPKRGLRRLQAGDLLVFYAGLQGWGWKRDPGLYIIGYFEVEMAGIARQFSRRQLTRCFAKNFHVRHRSVLEDQRDRLILVKGGKGSRLLERAFLISCLSTDRTGRPLKVLSPAMCRVFGDFAGRTSIQRSPPRWVNEQFVDRAAAFVRSLP